MRHLEIGKTHTRKTVVEPERYVYERYEATRKDPTDTRKAPAHQDTRKAPRTPGHQEDSHGLQDTRKAPMTLGMLPAHQDTMKAPRFVGLAV